VSQVVAADAASQFKSHRPLTVGEDFAAMGIYVANADDAPGAAVIGMLLMVVQDLSRL
jgi:hypothetical protein